MNKVFLVTTNRQSWGKGHTVTEALLNALRHGGDMVTNVTCLELRSDDVKLFDYTRINDEGMLVSVKDAEILEMGNVIIKPIVKPFFEILYTLDTILENLRDTTSF